MTYLHISQVPDEAEIFAGPRGGNFFFRNGKKVYVSYTKNFRQRRKVFNPPRGAFHRFLNNQSSIS